MINNLEDAKREVLSILKAKNYKLTKIRELIVDCLLDGQHMHTIDDIVNHLKITSGSKINLMSVYNNIQIFLNAGLINTYSLGSERKIVYEFSILSEEHMHLFDEENRQFLELPMNSKVLSELKEIAKKNNFAARHFKIEIHGKKIK